MLAGVIEKAVEIKKCNGEKERKQADYLAVFIIISTRRLR